jgi:AhpD family alkylhydroperoxidase
MAIVQRCGDCITLHVHDALRAGATADQVHETVGVAIMMGGGPASMYATQVEEALDQFGALATT